MNLRDFILTVEILFKRHMVFEPLLHEDLNHVGIARNSQALAIWMVERLPMRLSCLRRHVGMPSQSP